MGWRMSDTANRKLYSTLPQFVDIINIFQAGKTTTEPYYVTSRNKSSLPEQIPGATENRQQSLQTWNFLHIFLDVLIFRDKFVSMRCNIVSSEYQKVKQQAATKVYKSMHQSRICAPGASCVLFKGRSTATRPSSRFSQLSSSLWKSF